MVPICIVQELQYYSNMAPNSNVTPCAKFNFRVLKSEPGIKLMSNESGSESETQNNPETRPNPRPGTPGFTVPRRFRYSHELVLHQQLELTMMLREVSRPNRSLVAQLGHLISTK